MNSKKQFLINNPIIMLILGTLIFLIIFFVKGFFWVNYIDIIADIFGVMLLIGIVVLGILALQVFYSIFARGKNATKKLMVIFGLVGVILINLRLFGAFGEDGYSTGGVMNIVNKKCIDGVYSFYIEGLGTESLMEIECNQETYEKLITNEKVSYHIKFRWLSYKADKGVLGSIDTGQYIDNR